MEILGQLWREEHGQDVAEYAVMLSVIVAIAVATVRMIGSSAEQTFSMISSAVK
jgi:Flp pilus assembly pilin Flp